MMRRVVFTPSGLEGKVADGTTVLEAARQLGADRDCAAWIRANRDPEAAGEPGRRRGRRARA